MARWLLLLFTVVPLVELYLLLWLSRLMGFLPTVGLVLVTGVLGATLAKREGLRVFRTWRETLAQGRMPEEGLLGGVLVLMGGVLLVTPGVLTDLCGLLLLLPPGRRFVAARVRRHLERAQASGRVRVTGFGGGFGGFGGPPQSEPAAPTSEAEPGGESWERLRDRRDSGESDAELVDEGSGRP